MRVLPYNVRQVADGKFTAYLPEHPYIGSPVWGTRNDAMRYIAERCGLTLKELRAAIKDRRLALHPHSSQPLLTVRSTK